MCTRITCPRCRKPSFSGCGRHVEMVLGNVPRDQRCRCADEPRQSPSDSLPAWLRNLIR